MANKDKRRPGRSSYLDHKPKRNGSSPEKKDAKLAMVEFRTLRHLAPYLAMYAVQERVSFAVKYRTEDEVVFTLGLGQREQMEYAVDKATKYLEKELLK